ncbi:MAG: winged helix-turn-helix domain-containing protein [Clostridia bacterium]|nr:winged helix-turn-helix domain-containing protein [Clostridia bacterium]
MPETLNNNAGKEPLYVTLYRRLAREIEKGAYALGTKMPSKRICASENGISVLTVEHAYAWLCEEGYIEAKERSGYYVIYRREDFLKESEIPFPSSLEALPTVSSSFPHTVFPKR